MCYKSDTETLIPHKQGNKDNNKSLYYILWPFLDMTAILEMGQTLSSDSQISIGNGSKTYLMRVCVREWDVILKFTLKNQAKMPQFIQISPNTEML